MIFLFLLSILQFLFHVFWGSFFRCVYIYNFNIFLLYWWFYLYWIPLFLVIFLVLKSILSNINIVIPTLLWLLFAYSVIIISLSNLIAFKKLRVKNLKIHSYNFYGHLHMYHSLCSSFSSYGFESFPRDVSVHPEAFSLVYFVRQVSSNEFSLIYLNTFYFAFIF